jgi:hypothetical protein
MIKEVSNNKLLKSLVIVLAFITLLLSSYNNVLQSSYSNDETLTKEKALEIVKEKYAVAQKVYDIYDVFEISDEAVLIDGIYYNEIVNYDNIASTVFTKKGKQQFENYYRDNLIRKDNKVYFNKNIDDKDIYYVESTFTKENITPYQIECVAKSQYVNSRVTSSILDREDTFTLINTGTSWLIDHVVIPY